MYNNLFDNIFNLYRGLFCGTVLKALEKSKMPLPTWMCCNLYIALGLVLLLVIVSHMSIQF